MRPIAVLLLLAAADLAFADVASEPLPPEALLEMEVPRDCILSPDARWVAVVSMGLNASTAGAEERSHRDRFRQRLQVIEIATGRALEVGPEDQKRSAPVWSPDGKQLAFVLGGGADTQLWLWSTVTHQAHRVKSLQLQADFHEPVWMPDSRGLIVAVPAKDQTRRSHPDAAAPAGSDAGYPLEPLVPGARVAVYRSKTSTDRQDYASNERWRRDLVWVDASSGDHRPVVTGQRPTRFSVSPDGRTIVWTNSVGQAQGSGYRNLYDVTVAALEGGPAKIVARDISQMGIYMDVRWSPDARRLAFVDSGPGGRGSLYVADIGGEVRALPYRDYKPRDPLDAPLWDSNGRALYLITAQGIARATPADGGWSKVVTPPGKTVLSIITPNRGSWVRKDRRGRFLALARDDKTKHEGLYAVDPDKGTSVVLGEVPWYFSRRDFDISRDGRILAYVAQAVDRSPQLWTSGADFDRPRKLTQLSPQLQKYSMGRSELLRWRTPDGLELQGALLLPSDYKPGRRVPLIVYLYGDEALSSELNVFGFHDLPPLMPYENMQLLATRGYAVLRPDTVTRVGSPMKDIYETMMPGVDAAIDAGIADPQRLGIMGRSYGGYSVLSVLVQTQRFKAAIEVAGNASMHSVFNQMTPAGTSWSISWAEESQGKMGGTLWEYPERYRANSPLFYFDRLTTPLLIVHGTRDTAVYVQQGDEVFQALRRLGREVEYAKYLGQTHVIAGTAESLDYARRMIGWFDRHLKARSPAIP